MIFDGPISMVLFVSLQSILHSRCIMFWMSLRRTKLGDKWVIRWGIYDVYSMTCNLIFRYLCQIQNISLQMSFTNIIVYMYLCIYIYLHVDIQNSEVAAFWSGPPTIVLLFLLIRTHTGSIPLIAVSSQKSLKQVNI